MKTTWLMKGFPSMEDMDWGRYGILTFDDKWLRELWKMIAAFKIAKKAVKSLSELVVWDYSVSFYDKLPKLTVAQENRLEKYEYIELEKHEASVTDDDFLTRTECETMHIDDDGQYVYWSVIVKHTDVRVETPRLFVRNFECELHGRNARKRKTCIACAAKL